MGLFQKKGGKEVAIPVEGMSCMTCEMTIQHALGQLSGIRSSKANAKEGHIRILYTPEAVSVGAMVEVINKTGFKASPPKE